MNYKEIKSYEDACKVLGVQPISENAVAAFPAEDRKSMLAYHKLTIITRAINGGWKPDWTIPTNTSITLYSTTKMPGSRLRLRLPRLRVRLRTSALGFAFKRKR